MGTPGRAAWVRNHYNIPAKRGMTIRVGGLLARITGFRYGLLLIRYPEDPGVGLRAAHPVWAVEYPPLKEEE